MAGDNAKAKTAYQDFLTLWKEGQPSFWRCTQQPKRQRILKLKVKMNTWQGN